ncbi:MAG: NAD(P)H-binding protein [Solirubrobacteraceae bacterium]
MRILVTGITGYVGSRLVPRLLRDGHEVRGCSRAGGSSEPGVPVYRADAVSGAGLARALEGIEVAYFLIHSMEGGQEGPFGARERAAAENFARAAQTAGVARVVYLGGLKPEGELSAHLASRLAVEHVLLGVAPCAIAFRASIVIGASSRPFRFLVRLVERLPVLALPAWRTHRTCPIDERDVIELLARAATRDGLCGQSLDIAGPETVSYGELIDRIRHHMLLGRPTIGFDRLNLTPIASRIAASIADEEHALIGPLMESLAHDLLPREDHGAASLGVRRHSLDAAIEHSLREWESTEALAAR